MSNEELIASAWERLMNREPMTQDEATAVWWEMHQIIEASEHPQARIVHRLNDQLARERFKGKRCSVCARYDDPDCTLRC